MQAITLTTDQLKMLDQQALILTLSTIEDLSNDALLLLIRLMKQVALQDTTSTYSHNTFLMKGLKMGTDTFYKAKKELTEKGYISTKIDKDDKGRIKGKYVVVHMKRLSSFLQQTSTILPKSH